MPDIVKKSNLYPVWMASKGNKYVVAQDQQFAIDNFILHYGYAPTVVINGLYATKQREITGIKNVNNTGGRGVGEG